MTEDVIVAFEESELSKKFEISEDGEDGDLENEDSESKLFSLISLISQVPALFLALDSDGESMLEWESKLMPLIVQTISLVRSMDFDSQPKPETKLMSLVTQTVSLFNSTDLDSLPEPLRELISQKISKDSDENSVPYLYSLICSILSLKPAPKLVSLIRQIVSVVIVSMNPELKKLTSLCPQVEVLFDKGKFRVYKEYKGDSRYMWGCFTGDWEKIRLTRGEDDTHFHCTGCNGEDHQEYEQAPVEIKHPLHPKHFLQLVSCYYRYRTTRKCYCCDEDLTWLFYYCSTCDYAMKVACVEKPQVLSIPPTKWHEHTLSLFPSQASLPCNVCALTHSSCPFYICPPCDFVVHQRCLSLPRVIKISRHPHRISFTPSFDQSDWSCRICRRKIDNDYGAYSCIKNGCLYAAHSRCATLKKVWDGIDLDGAPEEIEEVVVEPFVRASDGTIIHFSHEHHHLRLDDNTSRDYDENRQCQACITPIYFGNLYSCVHCDFFLHETCANLSRKIDHPIHPHKLTLALVGGSDDDVILKSNCSACFGFFTAGFFYECCKDECAFQLHVQCAIIIEPLLRESHVHPLFLTSEPGEFGRCCVCGEDGFSVETFNCIECDNFAMCFRCATLPQKVRYKHDKHILTLSYRKKTSTVTYWCEACEREIYPEEGFYVCEEYCWVTLHITCLIGELYMKPGSSFTYSKNYNIGKQLGVLPNNHHMTRPICSKCKRRCPEKVVFQYLGAIFCSLSCVDNVIRRNQASRWLALL